MFMTTINLYQFETCKKIITKIDLFDGRWFVSQAWIICWREKTILKFNWRESYKFDQAGWCFANRIGLGLKKISTFFLYILSKFEIVFYVKRIFGGLNHDCYDSFTIVNEHKLKESIRSKMRSNCFKWFRLKNICTFNYFLVNEAYLFFLLRSWKVYVPLRLCDRFDVKCNVTQNISKKSMARFRPEDKYQQKLFFNIQIFKKQLK